MANFKRIEYYDFLRGLAILMVVGIHSFAIYPIESLLGVTTTVIRQILNCAVPLFLALSGLFLGKKVLDTKTNRINFWKKQIPKVYIPAIIWSFPLFFTSFMGQNWGGISL